MDIAGAYSYLHCRVDQADTLDESITALLAAFEMGCRERGLNQADAFCLRFFCSDVHRQARRIRELWPVLPATLMLFIGQPPLDSCYLSMQASFLPRVVREELPGGGILLRHGSYSTFLRACVPHQPASSEVQTGDIINQLKSFLSKWQLCLADNVMRTWYYIRDIDNNYAGMIRSRTRYYEAEGLTPKTHFIASTGIESCAEVPYVLSWLVAEAQQGLLPSQVVFLKALSHLSPTHAYGVNFERATSVQYGDCRHVRLSGTASIDALGNIMHEGNIRLQLKRSVDNIAALLAESDMNLSDMKSAIVYLRDAQDYMSIKHELATVFPKNCAVSVVHAPVCRPGWLVEIEGEALAPIGDTRWPRLNGGI